MSVPGYLPARQSTSVRDTLEVVRVHGPVTLRDVERLAGYSRTSVQRATRLLCLLGEITATRYAGRQERGTGGFVGKLYEVVR